MHIRDSTKGIITPSKREMISLTHPNSMEPPPQSNLPMVLISPAPKIALSLASGVVKVHQSENRPPMRMVAPGWGHGCADDEVGAGALNNAMMDDMVWIWVLGVLFGRCAPWSGQEQGYIAIPNFFFFILRPSVKNRWDGGTIRPSENDQEDVRCVRLLPISKVFDCLVTGAAPDLSNRHK